MGRIDALKQRLLSRPKDFTFSEANTLLGALGFDLRNKGKTSGSRVMFYRERDKAVIMLHKPHQGNDLPRYTIKDLIKVLVEKGDLHEG